MGKRSVKKTRLKTRQNNTGNLASDPHKSGKSTRFQRVQSLSPIVPSANVSSTALTVVLIIMSFLACLTLGFVTMIQETAQSWQTQISKEITIQVKPVEGRDMDVALEDAKDLALSFEGTIEAEIIDRDNTAKLLEPWLGEGFDMDELPVPRLVVITIDERNPPNFNAMRDALSDEIPNAFLDDHRTWADRLVNMADNTVFIGVGLLALVLCATVLTVVFATRGAMSVNHEIIEVLHFIGAESAFVAKEFQGHFLKTGLYGGGVGGICAALLFLATDFWQDYSGPSSLNDQATALFGDFSMGIAGYLGIFLIIVTIAGLTAVTTRVTVLRTIREIDLVRSDPSQSDQV